MPEVLEKQLVDHALNLESQFYGLTPLYLRKLAFEVAEANHLKTRFNAAKKVAGKEWLQGFFGTTATNFTSLARASGFSRNQFDRFFKLLSDTIEKIASPPTVFTTWMSLVLLLCKSLLESWQKRQTSGGLHNKFGKRPDSYCDLLHECDGKLCTTWFNLSPSQDEGGVARWCPPPQEACLHVRLVGLT